MNEISSEIYVGFEPWPKDVSGWHGESAIFDQLIQKLRPKTIIEVGTWKGLSALKMAQCLKSLRLEGKIYCVDTWLGSGEFWGEWRDKQNRDLRQKNGFPQIYFQFISNVIHCDAQNYILPFPNTSLIAARCFQDQGVSAELIYIDASHEEKDVFDDLCEYWKLLAPGGMIFGDDFHWKTVRGSVRSAIERFCDDFGVEYAVEENCFWIISKPIADSWD